MDMKIVKWYLARFSPCIESGPEAGKNQSLCDLPKPSGNNLLQPKVLTFERDQMLAPPNAGGLVFKVWYYIDHWELLTIPFSTMGPCFSEVPIFLLKEESSAFEALFLHTKWLCCYWLPRKCPIRRLLHIWLDIFPYHVWLFSFKHADYGIADHKSTLTHGGILCLYQVLKSF